MAELEKATKPTLDKYCNWCCGACGKMLFGRDERCPWCGKAVKWDEPPKEGNT